MNRQQLFVVSSAIVLFFILYFGCDIVTSEQKTLATSRALTTEALDITTHAKQVYESLKSPQNIEIQSLSEKAKSGDPSVLKQLSAAWHNAGHDEIAAWYAEQVAEKEKTDESWSIAGANYYLALEKNTEKSIRDFSSQKAVNAFQNAISINPSKIEHRINLALCYTENPMPSDPMKGILMLRELDAQNPDNVVVNIQLARLAIKTGQFDKAIGRLEKIIIKEPNNKRIVCLLAEAYQGIQNPKASEMAQKCNSL
jgi:tetratricopeptide (TPR) repeat protein